MVRLHPMDLADAAWQADGAKPSQGPPTTMYPADPALQLNGLVSNLCGRATGRSRTVRANRGGGHAQSLRPAWVTRPAQGVRDVGPAAVGCPRDRKRVRAG